MNKVPKANNSKDACGADIKIAVNAGTPTNTPPQAMRNGSAPRPRTLEAQAKPVKPPKASKAVNKVVSDTAKCKISPPKGSSNTSPMLKAMVPKPTANKRLSAWSPWVNSLRAATKSTSASWGLPKRWVRASCFHKAVTLSTKVSTAAPCTDRTKAPGEKSRKK